MAGQEAPDTERYGEPRGREAEDPAGLHPGAPKADPDELGPGPSKDDRRAKGSAPRTRRKREVLRRPAAKHPRDVNPKFIQIRIPSPQRLYGLLCH